MKAASLALVLLIPALNKAANLGRRKSSDEDIFLVSGCFYPGRESLSCRNYSIPVPDMIRGYDYPVEVHEVTTEDGYINTLHRIPPKKKAGQRPKAKAKNRAVFIQHGLLGTSADFVMGRPDKSLGYMLSDLGYDVWLGNFRGNAYSRKHRNLTVEDTAYWSFSFDEMGQYDIPAALEYVKSHQSDPERKLFYIGHSMGTVAFWVASNNMAKEWMESHVEMMVAMGPVAKVANIESPLRKLVPYLKEIEFLIDLLGINEFEPSNHMMQLFDKLLCDQTAHEKEICENVVFLITGFDEKQMNKTLLPIILGHEPGGTSTRTVIHFVQEVKSQNFCKFDFGYKGNALKYNQVDPPEYKLERVTVPVALMWGRNDWLADPRDVTYLFKLPNLVYNESVDYPEFNHIDFLWAMDADKLVYSKIFKLFEQWP